MAKAQTTTGIRLDQSVNQLDAVRNGRHSNSRKTSCPKRHKYDLVIERANGRTYRACSICRRNARSGSAEKVAS